jgi:hypothetical protein
MGSISTTDARGLYTKYLIDVYRERISPLAFLRSFFPTKESVTKFVSIDVQRGSEKVAVDVQRGTEGNRNTFNKSTEKIFEPPYYKEFFDATQLDLYDKLFGLDGEVDNEVLAQLIDDIADKYVMLTDKIERAYELQCAQVLETGIVTLNAGINIDFKRKAGSLVDNSGSTWATGTNDPLSHLEAGANFLRQTGKSQGGIVNVIMGSAAFSAFIANATVKARADIRNFSLDSIRLPQRNSVGAVLQGEVAGGSYAFRLWTYPEYYENSSGVMTPYVNPKKVILLPETPRFKLAFAGVPQLLTKGAPVKKGAFVFGDYIDQKNEAHIFDVKSAGVAVPVAVDQIYTTQVLA